MINVKDCEKEASPKMAQFFDYALEKIAAVLDEINVDAIERFRGELDAGELSTWGLMFNVNIKAAGLGIYSTVLKRIPDEKGRLEAAQRATLCLANELKDIIDHTQKETSNAKH